MYSFTLHHLLHWSLALRGCWEDYQERTEPRRTKTSRGEDRTSSEMTKISMYSPLRVKASLVLLRSTSAAPAAMVDSGVYIDGDCSSTLSAYPVPLSPPFPLISKKVELARAMTAASKSSLFTISADDFVYEDDSMVVVSKPSGVYCESVLSSTRRLLEDTVAQRNLGILSHRPFSLYNVAVECLFEFLKNNDLNFWLVCYRICACNNCSLSFFLSFYSVVLTAQLAIFANYIHKQKSLSNFYNTF